MWYIEAKEMHRYLRYRDLINSYLRCQGPKVGVATIYSGIKFIPR